MTRLWPEGQSITVICTADRTPYAFRWDDRHHPVQTIAKRWRIDEGWWQSRIWREYFKLTTRTGLMVVIYFDWLHSEWFLQRLYD